MEEESIKRVEAALFISGRFLSINEIVMITGINPLTVKEMLAQLKKDYENKNSSVNIIEKGGLWKMDVKSEYHYMIPRLASGKAEFSNAEQETLAIIAYKQPIKQSVVVKIRSNKAYEHIKRFLEFGLLKSKRIGHTLELQLTEQFYTYFQLGKKEKEGAEIPEEKEIQQN